ncbi:hypothetical protein HPO96_06295 [Kribbella sandramycini]|uniref:Cell wall-associated NlpC family hydrolase n=1 Tax=Kribbella sandramycini TaxID=60450 RepID=A0A7Y4KWF5_9ACTN|nr:hypothetical protein [Kribbella sandramycini]MBB6567547.1 hypothetical protein [Kribbella sandramycini]NOL39849.1 hypothetical protein [Kribbella sandramycini]
MKIRLLITAALLFGSALVAPAPAQARELQVQSVANGALSRQEILLRSASWIRDKVPYSQDTASPHVNEFGSYRRDCSGFLSMAWHLSSSLNTGSLPSVMHRITADDLQPGDALWRQSGGVNHVGLFVGWADAARTRPKVREEYDFGKIAEERIWSNSYFKTFTPYRYNKVIGATASPGSSVGQDVTGRLQRFEATTDGGVQLSQQTAPAAPSWEVSTIDPPGGVVPGEALATAADSIGRAYYFARTPNRKLRTGWQSSPGAGPWLSATIEPTTDHDGVETVEPAGRPAAAIDARGKLTYFVRTSDGRLLHGWQDQPGSSTWHATLIRDGSGQQIQLAGEPVVAQDVQGRIIFLARTADGQLRYGRQAAPGTGPWVVSTLAASGVVGNPSVALDVSGKLVYFVRGTDGQLQHGWQSTPGADTWQSTVIPPTTDTDGVETVQLAGDPAISLDHSGKLTYFVRTTDQRILHGWQDRPGSDPWHATIIRDATSNAPAPAGDDPVVYADSASKLVVLTHTADGVATWSAQHAPGTGPWHVRAVVG